MRLNCFFAFLGVIISMNVFGQQPNQVEKPFIEVSGTAEKEVVPDEIYIKVTIRERFENKEKITVSEQEEKLKAALSEVNIPMSDVSMMDAGAGYTRVRWRVKDVVTQKNYQVKVATAEKVSEFFLQLDKINIQDAHIFRVNHSKMDSLRKRTRILAIKAAKEKADYLLNAIGEKVGKPLIVREVQQPYDYSLENNRTNVVQIREPNPYADGDDAFGGEVQFRTISIKFTVFVKFEIL